MHILTVRLQITSGVVKEGSGLAIELIALPGNRCRVEENVPVMLAIRGVR